MDLVNADGTPVVQETQQTMTVKEVGEETARRWLEVAMKAPTNEGVNIQFEVLYTAALNILAHRIVNVGLGFTEGNLAVEWEPSRAFASEKQCQEDLTATVDEWKTRFFNGELAFNPGKKS